MQLPLLGFNVVCGSIGGDDSGNIAIDLKAFGFVLGVKLLTMVAVWAREC